jgi:hypothetical protein
MGLFNRDYDRNYGYRGTGRTGYGADYGARGYDRDMGDRAEGTWESMKRGTREFFGMDNRYDRGYGAGYDRDMNTTYNRGTMGAGGYGNRNRGGFGATGGYSQTGGYGGDYAGRDSRGGYDRPYRGHDTWRYDDNYKSREQTDAGDPFGDRQSGTPIRVMDEPRDRGGWFGGSNYDRDMDYDRNFRGNDRNFNNANRGYGGNDYYGANPMGYDPYDNRGGGNQRMGRPNDAGFRNNRGYDRDWF